MFHYFKICQTFGQSSRKLKYLESAGRYSDERRGCEQGKEINTMEQRDERRFAEEGGFSAVSGVSTLFHRAALACCKFKKKTSKHS